MNAPAYQGIKDFILARIHAGEWSEGDQVPSENELAREFKVARMTVNRALRELTAEQVLTRVQGAGTFVARPKYESTLVAIRSISDEILARGHLYRAEVLEIGVLAADEALAIEMGLAASDKVFNSRVLHFENDEPVQLEERWVNPAIAPDYAAQDFTHITPNQYLVRVAPLQGVEYRIEALAPEADTRAPGHGRGRALSRPAPAHPLARARGNGGQSLASGQPLPLHGPFLRGRLGRAAQVGARRSRRVSLAAQAGPRRRGAARRSPRAAISSAFSLCLAAPGRHASCCASRLGPGVRR